MRTAGAVLALAMLAGAGEENLLANGGFEDGAANWVLYGFEAQDSYEITKKRPAEGKCALHVTKIGGESVPRIWINYDLTEDQREGQLTFSFQAKGKKLKGVTVEFLVYDTSDGIALKQLAHDKPLKGTFRWKKHEITVDIPRNAKGGRIFLMMRGKGELWIDDYQLWHGEPKRKDRGKDAKEEPLQVENGDFERSKSGWNELPSPAGAPRLALDRKVKAGGNRALRLERRGDRLLPLQGVEQIVRELGRAKEVTLRCSARGDGSARAVVALLAEMEFGGVVECARREIAAEDFESIALTLKPPAHADRLRIVLAVVGPGRAWFDDVALEGDR